MVFGWVDDLFSDIGQGDYLFLVALALISAGCAWRMYDHFWRHDDQPHRFSRYFGLSVQLGVILMLERLYEFYRGSVAVGQLTAVAYSHAYAILNWEMTHGVFIEARLEQFFLPDQLLMHAIYAFYGLAHLFVTVGFLIWIYLRRNYAFSFVRNLIYLTSAMALVIYMVFPTAPPRMFAPYGFVDPATALGLSQAGGAGMTSYTYNPFAAMPSLHLVYALIVGATLVIVGKRLWIRALGVIYPIVMLAVILISANHWVLDAVGAVVVVAVCALILASIRTMGRAVSGRISTLSSA